MGGLFWDLCVCLFSATDTTVVVLSLTKSLHSARQSSNTSPTVPVIPVIRSPVNWGHTWPVARQECEEFCTSHLQNGLAWKSIGALYEYHSSPIIVATIVHFGYVRGTEIKHHTIKKHTFAFTRHVNSLPNQWATEITTILDDWFVTSNAEFSQGKLNFLQTPIRRHHFFLLLLTDMITNWYSED